MFREIIFRILSYFRCPSFKELFFHFGLSTIHRTIYFLHFQCADLTLHQLFTLIIQYKTNTIINEFSIHFLLLIFLIKSNNLLKFESKDSLNSGCREQINNNMTFLKNKRPQKYCILWSSFSVKLQEQLKTRILTLQQCNFGIDLHNNMTSYLCSIRNLFSRNLKVNYKIYIDFSFSHQNLDYYSSYTQQSN